MTRFARLLGAAALAGLIAAPGAAQDYPYPQQYPQYPQQYPNYPQQYPNYPQPQPQPQPQPNYPQPNYPKQYPYNYPEPYGQQGYSDESYGTEGTVGAIVDALIGNRYAVSDRQAIRRCAWTAVQRARSQYAYGRGFARVTAITDVSRRFNGVRVRGLLATGRFGYGGGGGYGRADLSFRCDVDYRGNVYDVRLDRARGY